MKKVISLVIALFVLISVAATPADAYGTLGFRLNPNREYRYFIHSAFSAPTFSNMNETCWRWGEATGLPILFRDPSVRHTLTDYGSSSSIDKLNIVYRIPVGINSYIAVNRVATNSGFLVESDINFNMDHPFSNGTVAGCYDTFSIFMHEMGHSVGLDDEYKNDEALMYAYWAKRTGMTFFRKLKEDDVNGVADIYGK